MIDFFQYFWNYMIGKNFWQKIFHADDDKWFFFGFDKEEKKTAESSHLFLYDYQKYMEYKNVRYAEFRVRLF